jgi:hypothetical protein
MVGQSEIQPVDLYEASALLVQAFAIERIAGDASALRFLNEILRGAAPARYVRVLALLCAFWRKLGRDIDLQEFGTVISWSLFGTFGKRPGDDHPTRRFLRLLDLFRRAGAPDFDGKLRDLYSEWDAALGYLSIEDAIRENAAANGELAAMFDRVPAECGDKLFRVIAQSCRLGIHALVTANKAMADRYLESPESYVFPDRYVDDGNKIQASIRFDFLQMGYRSDHLRSLGFEINVETRDPQSGEEVALSASLHPTGPNAIDGEVASRVALHIMICDYLLSDLSRHDMDFRLARQKLREIGVTTLELL